jgi:hypothetical protein
MPTITCTLGTDHADAALNRPALVLRPAEVEELQPLAGAGAMPILSAFLGAEQRSVGASQLAALRAELRAALVAIDAAQLPGRIVPALALQRLDTACWTAQELGLNLYVRVEED